MTLQCDPQLNHDDTTAASTMLDKKESSIVAAKKTNAKKKSFLFTLSQKLSLKKKTKKNSAVAKTATKEKNNDELKRTTTTTETISRSSSHEEYDDDDDDDNRSYISSSSLLLIQELRQQILSSSPLRSSSTLQQGNKTGLTPDNINTKISFVSRNDRNTFIDDTTLATSSEFSCASSKDLAKQMERALDEDDTSTIGSLPSLLFESNTPFTTTSILSPEESPASLLSPSPRSSFTTQHLSECASTTPSRSLGGGAMIITIDDEYKKYTVNKNDTLKNEGGRRTIEIGCNEENNIFSSIIIGVLGLIASIFLHYYLYYHQ
mmetsp:Transcript_36120/g.39928  ORF Transcript_36120/g.39928 Transcript_36120/m.39928 type:complete len:320 (-) Transcript_36120:140-1099(-)